MDEKALIDYCLAKQKAYLDYPFGESPICVKVCGKIFAEIYPNCGECRITLKCEPMLADFYRKEYPGAVLPGYHVPNRQKMHRNTVLTDKIPQEELCRMIDHSYTEVVKNFTKAIRDLYKKENMMTIRPMTIADYDEVYALWQITSKQALSSADEREETKRYLQRNPGISQVACIDGKIVGTALCGHDGRRGYLHHMAVLPEYRRKGIAKNLAKECLSKLRAEGIVKCHIFVFCDNTLAKDAWTALGWENRSDLLVYSSTAHNQE